MGTENRNNSVSPAPRGQRQTVAAGIALILIGLLLLAGQLLQSEALGLIFLLALGIIFLAWGSVTRQAGLLIPGGILIGLGAGILLITGPFQAMPETARGGIFLLSFAAGWVLIVLFSALFTPRTHWWPLIPASLIGLVGGAVLVSETSPQVLTFINALWPLGLIALGVYILLRRK